jgi:hypothetical protein
MKHKISLLLIFFISTFFSCRKDDDTPCDNKDYHYNLSEEDKSKVPYTGYDTLVFVSNTNDTAVCIGQGKKQFYLRTVIPNYTINNCSIPSTDNYEAYNYKFSSNNSKFKIDVNLYRDSKAGIGLIPKTLEAVFNDVSGFVFYLDDIGKIRKKNYFDSLEIKNYSYKNVYISFQNFMPDLYKMYYNQEFGVLKIQNRDSTEVWELLTKK